MNFGSSVLSGRKTPRKKLGLSNDGFAKESVKRVSYAPHEGNEERMVSNNNQGGNIMKNPLDSLWGTVISGLILTLILYLIVNSVMGS